MTIQSDLDRRYHIMKMTLCTAVPLWIAQIKERGGPTQEEWDRITNFAETLAFQGEVLMFGDKKQPGRQAHLFNRLAQSIAVMSFLPGGVTTFGEHWEASKIFPHVNKLNKQKGGDKCHAGQSKP